MCCRSYLGLCCVWVLGGLVTGLTTSLHQTDSHLWSWCSHSLPQPSLASLTATTLLTITFILPTLLMTVIYTKIYLEAHHSSERTRKCSLMTEVVVTPPPGESRPPTMRNRLSSAGQLMGREERRTAAVYLLSLSTNILCWGPLVISRIWPTSLPSLLVTYLALSFTIVSPIIFACR